MGLNDSLIREGVYTVRHLRSGFFYILFKERINMHQTLARQSEFSFQVLLENSSMRSYASDSFKLHVIAIF